MRTVDDTSVVAHCAAIAVGIIAVVLCVSACTVVCTTTHYLGETVVDSEASKIQLQELIDGSKVVLPFGIWENAYSITKTDSGQEILEYHFFSNCDDLPFTKD